MYSPMISDTRRAAFRGAIFFLIVYLSIGLASADQQVTLNIKGHEISATVANTFALRKKGLMNREHLAENEGMLFVFPKVDNCSMWMKNTVIPLSVAFIDRKGVVINIEEMMPLSLDRHSARKPVK